MIFLTILSVEKIEKSINDSSHIDAPKNKNRDRMCIAHRSLFFVFYWARGPPRSPKIKILGGKNEKNI